MDNKELKDNILDIIYTYNYTNEELKFIFDVIMFTNKEDYDLLKIIVNEFINKK